MSELKTSKQILLISADLFLGSRVRGAAETGGYHLEVASTAGAAREKLEAGNYPLVLVDLETPGLRIAEITQRDQSLERVIVAYGPHVRANLLDAARQAGCNHVLTRGQFDGRLNEVLSWYPADGG